MELINQHTKKIMEGCKQRALEAGLRFQAESLEYIVTNSDLIELTPKVMIPTLYDYWVHDVEVLKEKGRYELYPGNPYETVINTRPAISFYNDNNPDWLNVMIFYHVIGHIDFFQNNLYFRHTWDYDFTGQALSDKRMIAKLRSDKGRWVDYVIEFSRGIDNLAGFFSQLGEVHRPESASSSAVLDYYFDVFLQGDEKTKVNRYLKEIDRYNEAIRQFGKSGEQVFFDEIHKRHPEFEAIYQKSLKNKNGHHLDLIQFLSRHSPFLQQEKNQWMKSVMEVVRKTSLFFQPQIRTKIMNEGWASYWHEKLFLSDDRIKGHEVEFARVNAGVTSMPRVGLNPYALGMRLFYYLEESADKGRYSFDFQRLTDRKARADYNAGTATGQQFIFRARENLCDAMFVNNFIDQDFMDRHHLFVAGKRLNQQRMSWEYYVKSRKAEDYREMVAESLYHPPSIEVSLADDGKTLLMNHRFEEKPLVREFITNTMIGIEFLWGGPVQLETSEVVPVKQPAMQDSLPGYKSAREEEEQAEEISWQRVVYRMHNRKLERKVLG